MAKATTRNEIFHKEFQLRAEGEKFLAKNENHQKSVSIIKKAKIRRLRIQQKCVYFFPQALQ